MRTLSLLSTLAALTLGAAALAEPVMSFFELKTNRLNGKVGKDGQVKAAFASAVEPESAELKKALEKALAE